ncbi:MAG: hypothetical protein HFI21_16775 [Lachnospiraceae bacterium]|nr:hypothetical protein [Lachnospiraceae bacterium]
MSKNILQTNYSGNNGAPDLIVMSSETSEQKKAVMEEAAFTQVKQKYKNQILAEVYFTDRLSHLHLSNRLGVSASGLNATLKKINDTDPKPLREIRAGKFKYYSLTEDGKKYVKTEILSRLWDSEQIKEDVCNIWKLLNGYKESNQGKWNEYFTKLLLLEETGVSEERKDSDELAYEFLREYSDFYYKETEKAENLLSLLIADRELRQGIVSHVKIEYENHKGTVFDILNRWTEQNCEEVYQMVDQMFRNVKAGTKIADAIEVSLQGAEEYLEEIQNKILADILRASFRHLRKEELASEWIREDMGKQLAFYVAEKYRVLSESISCKGTDC